MTYLWDTNILLNAVRNPTFLINLNQKYDFSNSFNKSMISTVTIGEIHSIAFRNRWGTKKLQDLEHLIHLLEIIEIKKDPILISMYAEIDAYSQSQHPSLKLPISARKMGKNDLWIAATTAIHNATLLSTDNDFEHLNGVFHYFDKIEI